MSIKNPKTMHKIKSDDSSVTVRNQSRRQLVKRLALIAATGYLAPKAILISKSHASGSMGEVPGGFSRPMKGGGGSGPFGSGSSRSSRSS